MQFGQLNRRKFITAVGGAAVAWPLAAHAQQGERMRRVGVLTMAAEVSPFEAAFQQGLADLGYVVGKNLLLEYRRAAFKVDRLPQLATELVATNVDVILAAGSEPTGALQRQTSTIPIVTTSSNPVGLGFVASLARPGGNITGLSLLSPELAGKRLELLKELIPGLTKVAVFWNPNDPAAALSLQETQVAAGTLTIRLQILEVPDVDAFDDAFRAAGSENAAAVILLPAPLMSRSTGLAARLAMQRRLPTLFSSEEAVRNGVLISYGPSLTAINRRAAYFVDRILKGANPGDLPVEQPTKFELAINLKTAKALGMEVPPTLLALANEVIE
jgi:putative tryptophan/tyrosine transport system substrate-binding protein